MDDYVAIRDQIWQYFKRSASFANNWINMQGPKLHDENSKKKTHSNENIYDTPHRKQNKGKKLRKTKQIDQNG